VPKVIVDLLLDIVHLDKDVKKNMDSVPKEDVVKYGDSVLRVNVVVRKDIVELLITSVQYHWDVNQNLVDVINKNKRYDLNIL